MRWTGLRDTLCSVSGEWSHRSCPCGVQWLDPRPAPEAFAAIYPPHYATHEPPTGLLPAARFTHLRTQLLYEVLRRRWGYSAAADKRALRLAGRLLAEIPHFQRRAEYAVRFLPGTGGRVLDVGCGNGMFLLLMRRLGWQVEGLEPDPVAAAFARERDLDVQVATLEDAELAPNRYHAITLNHVLEHLPEPIAGLRRLAGSLRDDGVLISISPNPAGIGARLYGRRWIGLDPPRHFVLFAPNGTRAAAVRAGLDPRVWTIERYLTTLITRPLAGAGSEVVLLAKRTIA